MTDWTRIAKVAGMLGSDHDGELLNAARFLAAALKKEGASFGDLATRIERGGSSAVRERVRRVPENPAAAMAQKTLDRAKNNLDSTERHFLEIIVTTAQMTRGDYDLTTRQAVWLMALYDKWSISVHRPKPKHATHWNYNFSDAEIRRFAESMI